LLAALLAAGPVRADERVPSVCLLVQSSPMAGLRYHAAAERWDQSGWATPSSCVASPTILMIPALRHPNPAHRVEFEVYFE